MRPRTVVSAPQVVVSDTTGEWASASDAEREPPDTGARTPAGAESSGDDACRAGTDPRSRPRRVVSIEGTPADASITRPGLGSPIVGAGGTERICGFDRELCFQSPAAPVIDERIPNRETALTSKPDLEMSVPTRVPGGFDGSATAAQLTGRDSGRSVLAVSDPLERATEPTFRTVGLDRHGIVADGRSRAVLRHRIRVNICTVDGEFIAVSDSGQTSSSVRRKRAAG